MACTRRSACTPSTWRGTARSTWTTCASGCNACAARRSSARSARSAWTTLEHLDRDAQQALFEAQRLAAEFRLPALIHVRRAHAATIATLKRIRLERRGIIHAFAGSREEAREYLKLGFRLGLGGAPDLAAGQPPAQGGGGLPAEAIVLETDAPDMAPSMHPGQRNSPEHLPAICRALAELRGVDAEELAASSSRNAAELFGWD